MPNIKASLVLGAIEGDEAVDITPAVVEEPEAPVTPSDQPAGVSEEDRNALFLMCMQLVNPQGFRTFVEEHAVDMEVQGLVPSSEGLIAAMSNVKGGVHQAVHMAATLLAKSADSSLYDAYTAAVTAEESAVAAIMQTYGSAATTLVQDVIGEYIAKANSMQTNAGDAIRSMLDQARNEIPNTAVIESEIEFLDEQFEFCIETGRMCSAFESEINDEYIAYAGYAMEGDDEASAKKPGKFKTFAKDVWEKIKAFFRRIRDAFVRFGNFLKGKGQAFMAHFKKNKTVETNASGEAVVKAGNKLTLPALKFFRKSKETAKTVSKATDVLKKPDASDDEMEALAEELTESRQQLDSLIKETEGTLNEINTMREKIAEDTSAIRQVAVNNTAISQTLAAAEEIASEMVQVTAKVDQVSPSTQVTPARQKLATAAASTSNTVAAGQNKISKGLFSISFTIGGKKKPGNSETSRLPNKIGQKSEASRLPNKIGQHS